MLKVHLFGPLQMENDEQAMPPFATQKAASLFGYLLTYAGKDLRRDSIAEVLWPDRPLSNSRRSLHTALWQIRRVFRDSGFDPGCYLETSRNIIGWFPSQEFWFDVGEFELAFRSGQPERLCQAIKLYRGPFLENLYDEWCVEERNRLEEAYIQVLSRWQQVCIDRGGFTDALEAAFKLLKIDPLSEEAQRVAMLSLYQLGHRRRAIEQYLECTRLLSSELNIQPSEETRALYKGIVDESLPRAGPA
jgi:DNA-binding SARP family transcriptional activator